MLVIPNLPDMKNDDRNAVLAKYREHYRPAEGEGNIPGWQVNTTFTGQVVFKRPVLR